jgi:hypothetical protein
MSTHFQHGAARKIKEIGSAPRGLHYGSAKEREIYVC